MARINHIDTRNYSEAFYVVKVVRENENGLLAKKEFYSRYFYGSIMQDNSIESNSSAIDEVQKLSIKMLKTSTFNIAVGDLVVRNDKVFQIVNINFDLYNNQEQQLKANYLSELSAQTDLANHLKQVQSQPVQNGLNVVASRKYVDDKVEAVLADFNNWSSSSENSYQELKNDTRRILEQYKNDFNVKADANSDYISKLNNELISLDAKVDKNNTGVSNELSDSKKALDNKIEQNKKEQEIINSNVDKLIKSNSQELNASINETANSLRSEISKNKEDLENSINKNAQEAAEALNNAKSELSLSMFTNKQNSDKSINELKHKDKELFETSSQNKQDITELKQTTQTNRDSITQANNLIEELARTDEKYQTKLDKLDAKDREHDGSLATLRSELDSHHTKISALEHQHNQEQGELEKKFASLESANQDQNSKISQLELSLNANSKADSEVLKKFNSLSSEYSTKNSQLNSHIQDNKHKISLLETSTKNIADYFEKTNALNSWKTLWERQIPRIPVIEDAVAKINKKISLVDGISALEQKVNSHQSWASKVSKIDGLETKVSRLNIVTDKLNEFDAKFSSIDPFINKVNSIDGIKSSLENKINANSGKITSLNELKSKTQQLTSDLSALKSNKETWNSASEKINTLDTRYKKYAMETYEEFARDGDNRLQVQSLDIYPSNNNQVSLKLENSNGAASYISHKYNDYFKIEPFGATLLETDSSAHITGGTLKEYIDDKSKPKRLKTIHKKIGGDYWTTEGKYPWPSLFSSAITIPRDKVIFIKLHLQGPEFFHSISEHVFTELPSLTEQPTLVTFPVVKGFRRFGYEFQADFWTNLSLGYGSFFLNGSDKLIFQLHGIFTLYNAGASSIGDVNRLDIDVYTLETEYE
ncbi:Hypothetical protein MAGb_3200 [Mycoplasmopsis agalactiae 14628]|uniref:Uncharacterized protein n=1 Tax=Mycoplasmopsis agalactiae 14628 TaxID=1110504 RepID=I5D6A2_MYCAA|nr:hypothetical protein [Mycoplasmopsis agalactiae]EIN15211.1 Hypothetical protein MAGb_3200 [Mycoplasmopsis agalactiae 14628]